MKKEDFDNLSSERKKTIACLYLLKNKEERPEVNEKLFTKLEQCDAAIRTNFSIIEEAQKAMEEMNRKNIGLMGSIDTVVELLTDEMTEGQIYTFCMKYEISNQKPAAQPVDTEIDIAGATALKNTIPFDKKGNQ